MNADPSQAELDLQLEEDIAAPLNESKAARFKRVGQGRFAKAIKAIRLLSNLGNKYSYDYTDEQADKLIAQLRKEVDEVERALRNETADEGIPEL